MTIEGIYLVAGLRFHPHPQEFLAAVEESLRAGIQLFQLRIKDELSTQEQLSLAREVRSLTREYGVPFFMNDRPDLALLVQADGVHVGPRDLPVEDVRSLVGHKMMVGVSNHNWEELEQNAQSSADYLSVGPIFETDCKDKPDKTLGLEFLAKAVQTFSKPIVALGGIDVDRLPGTLETGVRCIGLIRGIMQSEKIYNKTKEYLTIFKTFQEENL